MRPLLEKLAKATTKEMAKNEIWKAMNAELRGYNDRRGGEAREAGGRTQLSKAKVIDNKDLTEKVDAAKKKAEKTAAAAERKKQREELKQAQEAQEALAKAQAELDARVAAQLAATLEAHVEDNDED